MQEDLGTTFIRHEIHQVWELIPSDRRVSVTFCKSIEYEEGSDWSSGSSGILAPTDYKVVAVDINVIPLGRE